MASEHVIELTDETFKAETSSGVVLVDLWAEWCMPCKMIAPIIDDLADELKEVKVCKLDVDSNPKTTAELNVTAIPSILLFKDGELVKKLVGNQTKMAIKEAIEELQ